MSVVYGRYLVVAWHPPTWVMALAQHMNSNLFVPKVKSRETKEGRLRILRRLRRGQRLGSCQGTTRAPRAENIVKGSEE
jgi:hypothetical protein